MVFAELHNVVGEIMCDAEDDLHSKCVSKCVKRSCSKGIADCDEVFINSCIARAILSKDRDALENGLYDGEDVKIQDSQTGMTYLHLLIRTAKTKDEQLLVPLLYLLSNAGVDVNVRDYSNKTALQLSIETVLWELMVNLLKVGAIPDLSDIDSIPLYVRSFKYEFLNCYRRLVPGYWDAVEDSNLFRVKRLVKSWCRINVENNGKSLIEYSKEVGASDDVVNMLLRHEATIEFGHAVIAGDLQRMQLLLCHGSVDLCFCDIYHQESLYHSCEPLSFVGAAKKYGHTHVMDFLCNQTRVTWRNSSAPTSYICAIQ